MKLIALDLDGYFKRIIVRQIMERYQYILVSLFLVFGWLL